MTGAEMIAAERKRQIEEEGFDATHDSQHDGRELAWAAACYVAPEPIYKCEYPYGPQEGFMFIDPWPNWWNLKWDKRKKYSDVRCLVIAGALIAAEVDRLLAQQAVKPDAESAG